MINHAQIFLDPQASLGEYMSPPGGSLWEITPVFLFCPEWETYPPSERHDTANVKEAGKTG